MSIDSYIKEGRLQAGRIALGRRRIYLDTKFWLLLRDVELGRSRDAASSQLLQALDAGVSSGRLVCPIEASVLREVWLQNDPVTRRHTAALIDRLSGGICIASFDERLQSEVLYFLYKYGLQHPQLLLPRELVWVRMGHILGVLLPVPRHLSEGDRELVQRMYLDEIAKYTLVDILDTMGNIAFPNPDYSALASRLNIEKPMYAAQLQSFPQAYQAELDGVLDAFGDLLDGAMRYLFESLGGTLRPEDGVANPRTSQIYRALLREALRRGKVASDELPYFHIMASLYADVRWNRKRRFKENDFIDFSHAAAALPYCDAFFTEKSLASSLRANHLRLDQRYSSRVASNCSAACDILGVLAS